MAKSMLDGIVKVYCSATMCRFKRSTGYYNLCHHPLVLEENKQFAGGHLYVSGCNRGCDVCTKKDCKFNDYTVKDNEE